MDMIILDLHRIYLKVVPFGYLLKRLLNSFCQITPQYHLAIFGNPYHMILQIIDRMACSSYWAHAQLISCLIASAEPVFIRPAELGGIQQVFLYKSWQDREEEAKDFQNDQADPAHIHCGFFEGVGLFSIQGISLQWSGISMAQIVLLRF